MILKFFSRVAFLSFAAFVLLCVRTAMAQTLEAESNRNRIYITESFQLTLRAENTGTSDYGKFSFDANIPAKYEFLGDRDASQHFISIVNGKRSERNTQSRLFVYRVTPETNGIFVLNRISVSAGQRILECKGPTVTVDGMDTQDNLKAVITSSRESVLVDEPFSVTLSVFVPKLHGDYATENPFGQNPLLEIPYLQDSEPPDGLRGTSTRDILQPLVVNGSRRFGFAINGQTLQNDPFSGFGGFPGFDPIVALFALSRTDDVMDGRSAFRYDLTLEYSPEKEGSYTFGPVLFKGDVIVGVRADGRPTLARVFTVAPAVTVMVIPPPEEGRPVSFIGSVGKNISAETRLNFQTCSQGDPLSVQLDIYGDISLSNLRVPYITQLADFDGLFRVYEDSIRTESIEHGRRFLYTVRPLKPGTIEFPRLPISYYDTEKREYVTVMTDPIPLQVAEVPQFSESDIIDTSGLGGPSESVRMNDSTPAAITVVPEGAIPMGPIFKVKTLLFLLPGPMFFAFVSICVSLLRHSTERRTMRRRRRALGHALSALRKSRTCQSVFDAVAGFFDERFGVPAAGFSPSDVEEILALHDSSLSTEIVAIIQPLFDKSFSPEDSDTSKIIADAKAKLPTLLKRAAIFGGEKTR